MAVFHFFGLVALVLSTTTLASPMNQLETREASAANVGLRCGSFTYSNAVAQEGFGDAIAHLRAGTSYNSATSKYLNFCRITHIAQIC
jgi:hypothetical protein